MYDSRGNQVRQQPPNTQASANKGAGKGLPGSNSEKGSLKGSEISSFIFPENRNWGYEKGQNLTKVLILTLPLKALDSSLGKVLSCFPPQPHPQENGVNTSPDGYRED